MNSKQAILDMMDGRAPDMAQKASDTASDVERAPILTRPGKYVMRTESMAWKDKKTGELIVFPRIEKTSKNSFALVTRLSVVDGTPEVSIGSSTIVRIVIMPAKGAKQQEDYDKVMKMAKPRLVALTGVKAIPMESQWMLDNLTVDAEEKDGKIVITRDHKMKQDVYVSFKPNAYQTSTGEVRDGVSIESFMPAKPGDKSVTYKIEGVGSAPVNKSGFGSSEGQTQPAAAVASDSGIAVDAGAGTDDDMPF